MEENEFPLVWGFMAPVVYKQLYPSSCQGWACSSERVNNE